VSRQAEKTRERRLRRMAQRQGLTLQKSRRRDPRAIDYGMWFVISVTTPGGHWRSRQLESSKQGLTLDEVERFLTADPNSDDSEESEWEAGRPQGGARSAA
jgi:hypothetical protein